MNQITAAVGTSPARRIKRPAAGGCGSIRFIPIAVFSFQESSAARAADGGCPSPRSRLASEPAPWVLRSNRNRHDPERYSRLGTVLLRGGRSSKLSPSGCLSIQSIEPLGAIHWLLKPSTVASLSKWWS